MPLTVLGNNLGFVRLWMPLHEFPEYLRTGLSEDPSTLSIEQKGLDLIDRGFPEIQTIEFVKSVCRWGGYPGIAGRVIKYNRENDIVSAFRRAHQATNKNKIAEALTCLLEIKGLAVSFASKHLKFVDATRHVVLDSIISARLGYKMSVGGYCEFLADCTSILKLLVDANISTPAESQRGWRVADVEMAIFQKLRSQICPFELL